MYIVLSHARNARKSITDMKEKTLMFREGVLFFPLISVKIKSRLLHAEQSLRAFSELQH